MKRSKPKASAGARFKKGLQKSAKFAARNPRLVIGVVGLGANVAAGQVMKAGVRKRGRILDEAARHARNTVAAKRGLGGIPGANLKAARRGVTGAYKIRSR